MNAGTVTGSRTLDRFVFAGVLALMLGATPRLLVYYGDTPAHVTVVAIAVDGTRTNLATPELLAGIVPSISLAERRILAFATTPDGRAMAPSGGRLEWSIHYSPGSGRPSPVRVIVTDQPR